MKKSNIFIFILFIYISGSLYAAGARYAAKYSSDSVIDRFINGNIINIETNRNYLFFNQWQNIIINTRVIYLQTGLFIVEDNWQKFIVYNEFFNESILSDFKLNEYIPITHISNDLEYNIVYGLNIVIIEIFRNNELRNKVEMRFDENSNRLISSSKALFNNSFLVYNHSYYYEYIYDNIGRLESVYTNYNDEKYLIKSIYYDGIFRTISRPFYINLETYLYKEIIIYNNNIIKYHIETRFPEYDRVERNTIEEEEAEHFLLIREYDNEGHEILQTLIREESEYFEYSLSIYKLENLDIDHYNNWVNQNVYFSRGDGTYRLLETFTRKITYK